MAYSDFTLAKAKETFDLTLEETHNLFGEVEGIPPSDYLTVTLNEYIPLATAINTAKARSTFLIAPILTEVRRQLKYQVSLFAGAELNLERDLGLGGTCDFILSGAKEQFYLNAPIIAIAEAKNENLNAGLGQCVASMIGLQLFNHNTQSEIETIYGVVTSGTNWRFLTLSGNTVFIDSLEYYVNGVDKILGILVKPLHDFILQNTFDAEQEILLERATKFSF